MWKMILKKSQIQVVNGHVENGIEEVTDLGYKNYIGEEQHT